MLGQRERQKTEEARNRRVQCPWASHGESAATLERTLISSICAVSIVLMADILPGICAPRNDVEAL
jgi:hypothetical protein